MSSFTQNATIVLVHGAWADGSCWEKVILPLQKEGLKVTCAPISLTSLTEDIATLQRVLARTSGPAVLVGHAYGGAVIAGPDDPRARSLVYISALRRSQSDVYGAGCSGWRDSGSGTGDARIRGGGQRTEEEPCYGDPEEIAGLMAYLVSKKARWLTGASVRMDGGEIKGI